MALHRLIYICLGLLLIACSNQPERKQDSNLNSTLAEMELKQGNKVERIRDYRVDSWRYVDTRNLIIEAGLKDQYLISLRIPCLGLRNAFEIGFTSTTGTLDKFEDIIVDIRHGEPQRCPISDIVKLEPIPSYPEGRPPEQPTSENKPSE